MRKTEAKTKVQKLTNAELPKFVEKLHKDIRESAKSIGRGEIQDTVRGYYQTQKHRKSLEEQYRAKRKEGKPCRINQYHFSQYKVLEDQQKKILEEYAKHKKMGRWAMANKGIGPIFATGLIAFIDMDIAKHPGHIYSFAGVVPGQKWEKGKPPPCCRAFKTLVSLIGHSFCFSSKKEGAYYGKVYADRMKQEVSKNDAGDFKSEAERALREKTYKKTTIAYKEYMKGKLPKAQLMARAQRYAAKLFISHWWHEAYKIHYNETPPMPWAIAHGNHTDFIPPPFTVEEVEAGLLESTA